MTKFKSRYSPNTHDAKKNSNPKSLLGKSEKSSSVKEKKSYMSHQPIFKNKTPNFKSLRNKNHNKKFEKLDIKFAVSKNKKLGKIISDSRKEKGETSLKKKIKIEMQRLIFQIIFI